MVGVDPKRPAMSTPPTSGPHDGKPPKKGEPPSGGSLPSARELAGGVAGPADPGGAGSLEGRGATDPSVTRDLPSASKLAGTQGANQPGSKGDKGSTEKTESSKSRPGEGGKDGGSGSKVADAAKDGAANKVAGAAGVDFKASGDRIKNAEGLDGKAREATAEAVDQGVKAAVAATGAGAPVAGAAGKASGWATRKGWPVIKVVLIAWLAILLVLPVLFGAGLLQSLTSSGLGRGGNLRAKEASDLRALEEFKQAGAAYDIPWSILAALAGSATETGKYSPYDTIDRDPKRPGIRKPSAGTATTQPGTGFVGPNDSRQGVAQTIGRLAGVDGESTTRFLVAWMALAGNATDTRNPLGVDVEWNGSTAGSPRRYADVDSMTQASAKALTDGGVVDALKANDTATAISKAEALGCRGGCSGQKLTVRLGEYSSNSTSYKNDSGVAAVPTGGARTSTGAAGTGNGQTVLVVGDSLCDASVARDPLDGALRGKGWIPQFECLTGRSISGGIDVLREHATNRTAAVIIALGTNDASGDPSVFASRIDEAIDLTGGVPTMWVNVATLQANAPTINQAIDQAATRHANVSVADFSSKLDRSWLGSDGIHLNGDGYRSRGTFIADTFAGGVSAAPGAAAASPQNPPGTEVSDFPIVKPAIGGGQGQAGVGPFLLRVGAVAQAGIDPQRLEFTDKGDPKTATDYVASQLSEIRYEMRKEGWDEKRNQDQFWSEAVRRLPIVDPRDAECKPGSSVSGGADKERQAQVTAEIRRMWECELGRASSLITLNGVEMSGGDYINTVEAAKQRSLLVQEALGVSYAFSNWGTSECRDGDTQHAGVFPISQAVFDEFAPSQVKSKGRCDAAANIAAAVRAFVAGESTKPGKTRTGNGGASIDSSGKIFPVTGTVTYEDTFGDFRAGVECSCDQGTNILAPQGAGVLAIEGGTVTAAGTDPVTKMVSVEVKGTGGVVWRYENLLAVSPLVRDGATIRTGDPIGEVGNSGDPQGPARLHLEARPQGADPVNPYSLLKALQGEPVQDQATDETGKVGDRTTALGPYSPMIGGWWSMPWVLGDDTARNRLLQKGPSAGFEADATCVDQVDVWVLGGGKGPKPDCGDARGVEQLSVMRATRMWGVAQSFTAEELNRMAGVLPEEGTDGDRHAEESTLSAGPSPTVPTAPTTTAPAARAFSLPMPVSPKQAGEYRSTAEKVLKSLGTSIDTGQVRPGKDPLLMRFNRQGSLIVPPAPATAIKDDYSNLVVSIAADVGALRPGDSRYEKVTDPWAKLSAFSRTAARGSTSGRGGLVGGEIPFAELFNQAAQETGTDARMLAAVAYTESSFSEDTIYCRNVSSAGAQGIMQFMPSTAAGMGVDPCDPNSAIPGGARLLAGNFERWGTWELAWASYNAGSGNVQKYGGVPPFPETQAYVVKVQQKWDEYKEKFPAALLSVATGAYGLPLERDYFIRNPEELTDGHWSGPASDLATPEGTPVYAVTSGQIVGTGGGDCGLGVSIRGDDGFYYFSCHLSQQLVTSGRVEVGQEIGLSGNTGRSTGAHLHLGIQDTGTGEAICPADVFADWFEGRFISPRDRSPNSPNPECADR